MSLRVDIRPVTFAAAKAFIAAHHRHHKPPQGWLFGASAYSDGRMIGVVCVGRPIARKLQDGQTCEVTRLCTDGTRNACSQLYAAAKRAAFALGYRKIITYTLPSEGGASLKASGFMCAGEAGGGNWDVPTRRRKTSDVQCLKWRWEAVNK